MQREIEPLKSTARIPPHHSVSVGGGSVSQSKNHNTIKDVKKIKIKCIKITPYTLGDNVLIDTEQIIPVKDAEDYLI